MNIYDTFIECYDNNKAYLNDEEIMDYFKSMVNNEFLNQESYNLIILNEQTIYKKYLYYDVLSKTFYFNKYILAHLRSFLNIFEYFSLFSQLYI